MYAQFLLDEFIFYEEEKSFEAVQALYSSYGYSEYISEMKTVTLFVTIVSNVKKIEWRIIF